MNTQLDTSAAASAVRLGHAHGYRFDGDRAFLNAELTVAPGADLARGGWALQLWACARPHEHGPLDGLKIAEAEVSLDEAHGRALREAESFARLPPSRSEYNMVLVLASGERGRFERVHDFSNYRERQRFSGPELEGTVSHRFVDDRVVLHADAVRNARESDNLSGDLRLELWASEHAQGGGELRGARLASAPIGRIAGQTALEDVTCEVASERRPETLAHLTLALTEWTHDAGYVTRAFRALNAGTQADDAKRAELKPADAIVSAPTPIVSAAAASVKPKAKSSRPAKRKK